MTGQRGQEEWMGFPPPRNPDRNSHTVEMDRLDVLIHLFKYAEEIMEPPMIDALKTDIINAYLRVKRVPVEE